MNSEVVRPGKKKYSRPIFRKLNREQALLFLLGHAWDGDPEAQKLLELVCPDPSEQNSEEEP
jgi:hypothetical protein